MKYGPLAHRIIVRLGVSLLAAFSTLATLSAADSDIAKTFTTPTANQDYIKREVMIPMRDGVKRSPLSSHPREQATRRFC